MVKSWGAFWALVGLVSLVAFGLWLDLSSPGLHCQYRANHCGHASENKNKSADHVVAIGRFLDKHAGAVSALTSVVIAAFTVALALTTRGLSQATRGLQDFAAVQADDMKQSLAIAARAADGAHTSANVAERTLEQTYAPYLDIAITPKAILNHFPGGVVTAQFHSGVFAEYTIVNYGSSPAVVLGDLSRLR
jgi:hypothetical protein